MADISRQPEIFNPATATNRQIIEYYSIFARYLVNNSIIEIDEGFLQQINHFNESDNYLNYYYFHIFSELLVHYSGKVLPVNVRLGYWLTLLGMHKQSQAMFDVYSDSDHDGYFYDDTPLILKTIRPALEIFMKDANDLESEGDYIVINPAKLAKLYSVHSSSSFGIFSSLSSLKHVEIFLRRVCKVTAVLTAVTRTPREAGEIKLPDWLASELNILLANILNNPFEQIEGVDKESRNVRIKLKSGGVGPPLVLYVPPPSMSTVSSMLIEKMRRNASGGPSSYPTR